MADEADDEDQSLALDEPVQVLVIDDHEISRNSVIRMLQQAGLTAIGAPSAIGATRLALRRGIQVAVIDLNMPAMRGSSLIQVIRKSPRLAHVGIVLLSGASDEELVTAAGEAGADAAVSKLNMKDTLVPVVKKLIARAARVPQQSGRFSILDKPAYGRTKRGGIA